MTKINMKRRYLILIVVMTVFAIIFGGYTVWGQDYLKKNKTPETYSQTEKRCGHKPVIGSKDGEGYYDKNAYYEPGPENENMSYDLLSKYDPANLDMSSYTDPEFFCSVSEAEAAGYVRHACCGVVFPHSR